MDPSVPGPTYLDEGWKKVTKASRLLYQISCFLFDGRNVLNIPDLTSPYPSNKIEDGGKTYLVGCNGTGIVQPANARARDSCHSPVFKYEIGFNCFLIVG
jgi:hypothetical protein